MKIKFLGGVDSVTGSQHLIECNGVVVLRDCGLYQGHRREAYEVNSRVPFDLARLRAVVLSHAHIDHCGNLPTLARLGYSGPIYATRPTVALCGVMLRDAAHIQEQDAAYLNQKTNRRGLPPVYPLYTIQDAEKALSLFQGFEYGQRIDLASGFGVVFRDAGHILGAAQTVFEERRNGTLRRLGIAVDLGRRNLPLIRDPEEMSDLDLLILESTYGDRTHGRTEDAERQLRDVVRRTAERGGKVLIPSFALERTQEVIYHLVRLVDSGELSPIPTYVDSPMATAITGLFERFADYLDEEYRGMSDRLGSVMRPDWVWYVSSVDESKAVTALREPCIVISASGMCEHGRILHHLKHGIEDPRNTVAFVGFQARNTLGRRLLDGEKKVQIFGDSFQVRAEVANLDAFSAHADQVELIEYVERTQPERVALVHGEPSQRAVLAEKLRTRLNIPVICPNPGEELEL